MILLFTAYGLGWLTALGAYWLLLRKADREIDRAISELETMIDKMERSLRDGS